MLGWMYTIEYTCYTYVRIMFLLKQLFFKVYQTLQFKYICISYFCNTCAYKKTFKNVFSFKLKYSTYYEIFTRFNKFSFVIEYFHIFLDNDT